MERTAFATSVPPTVRRRRTLRTVLDLLATVALVWAGVVLWLAW